MGYGRDDVGKRMVATIIHKYLKELMFPKTHVATAFLSAKFTTTSSTLHKYIIGMKYKGGSTTRDEIQTRQIGRMNK